MNVLRCCNAKKGPHKSFNAYSEFNDKELDGKIVAITVNHFGMENMEGIILIPTRYYYEISE